MDLPDDIIGKIYLAMCNLISIANFRQTCIRANILATGEYLWYQKKQLDFPSFHVHRISWYRTYRALSRYNKINILLLYNHKFHDVRYLKFKLTSTLREVLSPFITTLQSYRHWGFIVSPYLIIWVRVEKTNDFRILGYITLRNFKQNFSAVKLHLYKNDDAVNLLLDMHICDFPDYIFPKCGTKTILQLLRYMEINVSLPNYPL